MESTRRGTSTDLEAEGGSELRTRIECARPTWKKEERPLGTDDGRGKTCSLRLEGCGRRSSKVVVVAKDVLARVDDVQEAVFVPVGQGGLHVSHDVKVRETGRGSVLVFFVDCAHEGPGRRQHLVDKDKDGLLRCEFDPFPDHVDKLREVPGQFYERSCGRKERGERT
jgi:hypothetical protein